MSLGISMHACPAKWEISHRCDLLFQFLDARFFLLIFSITLPLRVQTSNLACAIGGLVLRNSKIALIRCSSKQLVLGRSK